MIGLSVFGITWKVPDKIVECLAVIGGLSIFTLFLFSLVIFIPKLNKKYDVTKKIKKHVGPLLVVVLILTVIIIFICPVGLWYFGLFEEHKLFANADTLGYYGALIGGGVTVLGVYWTLKYESKKSKEERKYKFKNELEKRKETNIPIFNFTIKLNSESHDLDDYDYYLYDYNLKDEFDNVITELEKLNQTYTYLQNEESKLDEEEVDTLDKQEKEELNKKLNNIQEEKTKIKQEIDSTLCKKNISKLSLPFSLTINNIGLQSAILYTICYISEGSVLSMNDDYGKSLNYLSVPKGEKTKLNLLLECYLEKKDDFTTEFKEAGYLSLRYTDLYRNLYRYHVPIKIKKVEEIQGMMPTDKYMITIDKAKLPILPEDYNEIDLF